MRTCRRKSRLVRASRMVSGSADWNWSWVRRYQRPSAGRATRAYTPLPKLAAPNPAALSYLLRIAARNGLFSKTEAVSIRKDKQKSNIRTSHGQKYRRRYQATWLWRLRSISLTRSSFRLMRTYNQWQPIESSQNPTPRAQCLRPIEISLSHQGQSSQRASSTSIEVYSLWTTRPKSNRRIAGKRSNKCKTDHRNTPQTFHKKTSRDTKFDQTHHSITPPSIKDRTLTSASTNTK